MTPGIPKKNTSTNVDMWQWKFHKWFLLSRRGSLVLVRNENSKFSCQDTQNGQKPLISSTMNRVEIGYTSEVKVVILFVKMYAVVQIWWNLQFFEKKGSFLHNYSCIDFHTCK